MKKFSIKYIASAVSLTGSLLFIIITIVLKHFNKENFWAITVLSALIIFAILFYLVNINLNRLIVDRINPIYKSIQNINISKKDLLKTTEKKDILKVVESDVLGWAQKRKSEIAELKKLEAYRKEFMGNVMHELKTPIFNIQGYILTLIDGAINDKSVNMKYLERTEKSINRMISIVEDLESISRLESGELKLDLKDFDLRKVIEESFEIHEMLAKNADITLKFAKNYDKPVKVYADKDRILEVINNLIINSVKYGKKGGATTVSFHDMDENLMIEISDTGIGIEEQHIPRLFERFYRVDKSRSREQGGTGLGLSIVKHIIEAHDQSINVRSTINAGTSFTFTLQKAIEKTVKSNTNFIF